MFDPTRTRQDAARGAEAGPATAACLSLTKPPDERDAAVFWRRLAVWLGVLAAVYLYSWILRGQFPVEFEEAQYWDWSRRLDWGYCTKPPLTAYLIRLFTVVFGSNPFGVRSTATTLWAGLSVFAYLLAMRLYRSPRIAFFSVLALLLMPMYSVGASIITTDTPLLFSWSACCFFLSAALLDRAGEGPSGAAPNPQRRAWLLAGVCFGLGLLSKPAMAYMIVCLGAFFCISPAHRFWLRRKEPYLFLLIGGVFLAPMAVWNWRHDWPMFRHVAAQAAADGDRWSPWTLPRYIGEQAGLVFPLGFLLMAWAAWRVLIAKGHASELRGRFLLAMGLPIYLLLLARSLRGTVLGNWAAPAYYTWTILTVAEVDALWNRTANSPWRKGLGAYLVMLTLGLLLVFVVAHERAVYGVLARRLNRAGVQSPVGCDPAYALFGYDQLAARMSKALHDMPRPEKTFIFSTRYQIAAELAFYMEGQPRTYTVNFGDAPWTQYDVWGGLDESKAGWDALFACTDNGGPLDPRIAENFESVGRGERLDVVLYGMTYRRFTFFRCRNFDGRFDRAAAPIRPWAGPSEQ
ncbi:MAG: glycosyltransferase family 39 protein [Candidatus Sumerlaeota bacterium]|nr:glycosyltransferase family 39 protein [Candidatus Sumerlaeota bacterium]